MTVLPDIVREAKIVSGKDQKLSFLVTQSTNITTYDANNEPSDPQTKDENSKVFLKKKTESEQFPDLIFNDKNRSTSYKRLTRSSDFINVKNSPIATRLIYNWNPVERQTTKVVSAKVKIYKPVKRIEMPGRPSSPYKVKTDFETIEPHFHNEKRSLEMKRLQYLNQHTDWSVYPYAGIEEREEYNKKIRDTLKGQIDQKDRLIRKENETKILEYKFVSEQDQNTKNEDKRKKAEKFRYLSGYRDENKQLMEDRWTHNYILKRHEWQQESQLLDQDPINWSKTLK